MKCHSSDLEKNGTFKGIDWRYWLLYYSTPTFIIASKNIPLFNDKTRSDEFIRLWSILASFTENLNRKSTLLTICRALESLYRYSKFCKSNSSCFSRLFNYNLKSTFTTSFQSKRFCVLERIGIIHRKYMKVHSIKTRNQDKMEKLI